MSPAKDYMRLTVRFPVLVTLCRMVCGVPTCMKDMESVLTSTIADVANMGKCASVLRRFVASGGVAEIRLVVSKDGTADGSIASFLCTLSPSR